MPPNGSGNDMPGGGPLTPGMQGNTSDSNLNAPKFTGNGLINSLLFYEDTYYDFTNTNMKSMFDHIKSYRGRT